MLARKRLLDLYDPNVSIKDEKGTETKMSMNPAMIMKLMSARAQFNKNHPKFAAFLKTMFGRPIEEGTVMEITVTRPGEEPITANIKIQASDLELLESLKELVSQQG